MSKIVTVTGSVAPAQCKMALSHEHLFIDLRHQAAPSASHRYVTAADRAMLMCDPYTLRDNLLIDDLDQAVDECRRLLDGGCDTVVDCSTADIGRSPQRLKRLAEATGMNIVMGCGFYTADSLADGVLSDSIEAEAEKLLQEVTDGCDGIRPGIIGEIGTSKEILPLEAKALSVAARVHKASGLSIQVHIYPWCCNGLAVVEQLCGAGVPPERIVICHSDVAPNWDYIEKLLRQGVYVQLDNYGKEFTPAPGGFAAGRFALDTERVKVAARIINGGYGKQLLMTNDICLKCMLSKFGGSGYAHIFNNIVPLLASEGIDEEYIRNVVLRENPLRMLAV